MAGILIGLSDLHYTKIVAGAATPAAAYAGEIKRLALAIEASVAPNTSNSVLYADDGAVASVSSEGETEIELTIDQLANDIFADILGKEVNADGVVLEAAGDIAPDIALAFRALKSNGKYRYFWYYKGSFQLPEEDYQTKGDTVEFNTPAITGVFVVSDVVKNARGQGIKRVMVDEDDTGVAPATIANWFTSVYITPPVVPGP